MFLVILFFTTFSKKNETLSERFKDSSHQPYYYRYLDGTSDDPSISHYHLRFVGVLLTSKDEIIAGLNRTRIIYYR